MTSTVRLRLGCYPYRAKWYAGDTPSGRAYKYRDLIIGLAAHHKLPPVYNEHVFVTAGGRVSYGSDFVEQCREAAHYVDRILRGEKPANLPVQAPTKFELVINLKAAKALGLTVPPYFCGAHLC